MYKPTCTCTVPGVDVSRVDGAGAEDERGERDGLPQQRRELGRGGLGRGELGRVAGVPADEAGVGEEGAVDLGRVGQQVPWHHEVGQDVGVAGAGTPRQLVHHHQHGGTQEQQPEAGSERHRSASCSPVSRMRWKWKLNDQTRVAELAEAWRDPQELGAAMVC